MSKVKVKEYPDPPVYKEGENEIVIGLPVKPEVDKEIDDWIKATKEGKVVFADSGRPVTLD